MNFMDEEEFLRRGSFEANFTTQTFTWPKREAGGERERVRRWVEEAEIEAMKTHKYSFITENVLPRREKSIKFCFPADSLRRLEEIKDFSCFLSFNAN
jgi:hypothetical protein